MKFDDFDKRMRVYEQSIDQYIVPGMYIVARLDGRSFTKLTREICKFEALFDTRFRNLMVDTTKHIMNCGFKVLYGYTESDEISLLFSPDNSAFASIHNRKAATLHALLQRLQQKRPHLLVKMLADAPSACIIQHRRSVQQTQRIRAQCIRLQPLLFYKRALAGARHTTHQ